jgi:hypothetical protein
MILGPTRLFYRAAVIACGFAVALPFPDDRAHPNRDRQGARKG